MILNIGFNRKIGYISWGCGKNSILGGFNIYFKVCFFGKKYHAFRKKINKIIIRKRREMRKFK